MPTACGACQPIPRWSAPVAAGHRTVPWPPGTCGGPRIHSCDKVALSHARASSSPATGARMLIVLDNVLTAEELASMRRKVEQAQYVSGAATAGEGSKSRKHNLQISERDALLPELQATVQDALARHQAFQFLAVPKHIMPPMFNRYDVGMYYQNHVDFSLVGTPNNKIRTDLSMTLFLSGQGDYDGGELVVESNNGAQAIK